MFNSFLINSYQFFSKNFCKERVRKRQKSFRAQSCELKVFLVVNSEGKCQQVGQCAGIEVTCLKLGAAPTDLLFVPGKAARNLGHWSVTSEEINHSVEHTTKHLHSGTCIRFGVESAGSPSLNWNLEIMIDHD